MESYCKFDENRFVIGNALIERAVDFSRGYPVGEYIKNKADAYLWRGDCKTAMFNVCGFGFAGAKLSFRSYESDNGGLSELHLCAEITYESAKLRIVQLFEIYDGSPFITSTLTVAGQSSTTAAAANDSPDGIETDPASVADTTHAADSAATAEIKLPAADTVDNFAISPAHLRVGTIVLADKSDGNDCYVRRSDELIYDHRENTFSGSMFLLDAYQSREGLLIVKEAPCIGSQLARAGCDIRVRSRMNGYVSICGSGLADGELSDEALPLYGVTVGVGTDPQLLTRLYKRHYAKVCKGSGRLFAMSNTWGDRSRDTSLCESFMLRERECAELIGVDVMQLDDGWQKGLSANSAKKTGTVWSNGFYREDPQFWSVNPEKFPSGLSPLMSDSVELALWFSADGDDDYASFGRDADKLVSLANEYGVRQFKLDGMTLKSKLGEKHICELLRLARERSNTDLTFNLDITAGVRLGYLLKKEIGTIFVENRYTDFVNYYPHATLKNLWMLSGLFPARKFQFELLNNRRNADKYELAAPEDELAPANYSIDWLFASVMVSNPLLWMELQYLDTGDTARLACLVTVWKRERDRLYSAEILPIGEQPDGMVYTGFQAIVSRSEGYLVLLRESSDVCEYTYKLDCAGSFRCDILAATGGFECCCINGGKLEVRFESKRSYAFIRYHND